MKKQIAFIGIGLILLALFIYAVADIRVEHSKLDHGEYKDPSDCIVEDLKQAISDNEKSYLKVVSIDCDDQEPKYSLRMYLEKNGRLVSKVKLDLIYWDKNKEFMSKELDLKFIDETTVLVSQGQGLIFPPGEHGAFTLIIDN